MSESMPTPPTYTVPNIVTDDDHGPWVTVVAATLMSWMVLTMLMRVAIRTRFNGPWGADDNVAAVGSAVALGQTISVFVVVHQGFGRKTALLSVENEITISKTIFASQILYIIAMALSKISTALLITRLTRLKKHRMATVAVSIVTGVWGIASVLAVSLRCNLSAPWSYNGGAQCVSPFTRWLGVEIVSMAIELLIFGLAIFLVWGLQMSRQLKLIVVGAFMCRPLVVVTLAVRIYYIRPVYFNQDPFFNGVNAAILTQVCMHYALMAATIPCTKPFITAFHSGYMDPEGYTAGSHAGTQQKSANGLGSATNDLDTDQARSPVMTESAFTSDRHMNNMYRSYSSSTRPFNAQQPHSTVDTSFKSNDSSDSSTDAAAYPVRRLSTDNVTPTTRVAPQISTQRLKNQAASADSASASPTGLFTPDAGHVSTTIEHNPQGRQQGVVAQSAATSRRRGAGGGGRGSQEDVGSAGNTRGGLMIRQTREYEVSYEPA